MSEVLLEVQELKKHFKVANGMLHAVDGVTFSVQKGKTLGIVGESGCGKSTLGRTVLKLVEPTSGKIIFAGEDITDYKKSQMRRVRPHMQMIFQDPYSSLNSRMSVQELIAEPIVTNKMFPNKKDVYNKVAELMDTVGLAQRFSGAYPHELDGGRRQRIGVARALALDPQLIVCDEPVSALDVSIQAQILNLLMDLQDAKGLTYLFITHDLSVVRHISTEIVVMYRGKCVELCPSRELFRNPLHPYTQALLAAILEPKYEENRKDIEIIKGEVISPVNPEPGCRFAPRCSAATRECIGEDLPLKEVAPNHFVACRLVQ